MRAIAPVTARLTAVALLSSAVVACGSDPAPAQTDSAAGVATAESQEPTPSRAAIDACAAIAQRVSGLSGTDVSQMTDSFPAFTAPVRRYGCVLTVEGPTSAATPGPVVATTLADSLGAGWTRDTALVADGPSETVYGIWRGDVLCLFRVRRRATRYMSTIGCEQLRDRVGATG